tara:strand:- start:3702 stop:3851 length:150 start_codon:yes stop_codon:yes gene_type:complete
MKKADKSILLWAAKKAVAANSCVWMAFERVMLNGSENKLTLSPNGKNFE